ncbi:MAG TPA: MFS transporter [Mucilaginibacter sp.]
MVKQTFNKTIFAAGFTRINMQADTGVETPLLQVNLKIIGFVAFTFIAYVAIGLSLAVLPVFIHQKLGFGAIIAGIVISLQYITTFLCRVFAGTMVDKQGPKPAVTVGMAAFTVSGILLLFAWLLQNTPALSLVMLVITRLITGISEGFVGSSPINWALFATSDRHTAKAISFNGIASYGGIAVGAPLGVIVNNSFGLGAIGVVITILAFSGFLYARNKPAFKGSSKAPREGFLRVLKKVSPYGICMGLGGLGFGTISTFITLYYIDLKWQGAVLCLSAFSIMFILGRLLFSKAIDTYGGMKTAVSCLSVECVGLLILWFAHAPYMAVIGAGITGFGFSLVFPALGVEAVKLVPASNKGIALSGYSLFIDMSLGLTGPLVGGVASQFGLKYIFPFALAMVLVALGMAMSLWKRVE